jgi:hypothetical protein
LTRSWLMRTICFKRGNSWILKSLYSRVEVIEDLDQYVKDIEIVDSISFY